MTILRSKIQYFILVFLSSITLLTCQSNEQMQPSELATKLGYSRQKPLLVGIDADYAPLEYVDMEGTPQGYDIKFTGLLMQRLGIPFTYQPNTWEEIAPDVLHGKVDLGMMIYSSYRKDSTNYSRAVFRLYYQVVYPKKNDDERFDFRNLEGKRIAYMKSRPVGEMLSNEKAIKFSITNLDEAMHDLVKGKYDAVICFRYQAKYLINLYHWDNLQTDDISLPPREYCYVSHDKELIGIIDRELQAMEKEGVTDEVYDIKTTFDGFRIPNWVWYLLGTITIVSLLIINRIYSHSRKQLTKANDILEKNNQKLKQRNEELTEAREKALESDRMKTAFIQNMSHEIRTPLNIVTGFAQVIRDDYEEISKDEMKMMVNKMMENTELITTQVNHLIELSILQSRHQMEKPDIIRCNEICREVASSITLPNQGDVKLNIETEAPEQLCMKTNKDGLTKVLTELLHNAIKFTQKGTITLRCYQTDGQRVCYSVTDTGCGIPQETRKNIFGQFVKADKFTQGLGVGLALCKNAINQLGGTIHLDEDYQNGTRIIVSLPLDTRP